MQAVARKVKQKQGGFTLIELLVVVGVLSVAAVIVVLVVLGIIYLLRHI